MQALGFYLVMLLITSSRALRLLIVQHSKEILRPTRTSPLLAPHCELETFTWSGRADNDALERRLQLDDSPVLVWPSDAAAPAAAPGAPAAGADEMNQMRSGNRGDKTTYCILDGTWQEASNIFRRGPPSLRSMPRCPIAPTAPSIYKLRKNYGYKEKFKSLGAADAADAALPQASLLLCTAEVGAYLLREDGAGDAADSVLAALVEMQTSSPEKKEKGKPTDITDVVGEIEGESVQEVAQARSFFVYLLQSSTSGTYIGATVDLARRLRQHNGVIKGGARATASAVRRGGSWKYVCHLADLPDWPTALQFEWRWKQLSRLLGKRAKAASAQGTDEKKPRRKRKVVTDATLVAAPHEVPGRPESLGLASLLHAHSLAAGTSSPLPSSSRLYSRLAALEALLALDRPTKNARLTKEWGGPSIFWAGHSQPEPVADNGARDEGVIDQKSKATR